MIKWKSISLRDLAGFISEELRKRDIETTLVGGACVTIYSENLYQSYDLDFVTYESMKKIKKALTELGFKEKQRYFTRDDCPWFIEFVSPPVAVGNEPIHKFEHIKTPLGTIQMLRPTDSVKDRLASFYHWSDKQGLEQALNICSIQTVDLEEIEKWSIREGEGKKFLIFLEKFKLIQFE
jgi:hypothetical protein